MEDKKGKPWSLKQTVGVCIALLSLWPFFQAHNWDGWFGPLPDYLLRGLPITVIGLFLLVRRDPKGKEYTRFEKISVLAIVLILVFIFVRILGLQF